MQQCIKILLFLIFHEVQHVSGDTPPIIRSPKLRKQPLDLHRWKVVGSAVVGRCQVAYASTILAKKIQQDATVYQHFIIPYFHEAQHVSGDTPPIIRNPKLRKQPLDLHTWKVVRRAVFGRCQVAYAT
jgi:hypothetical protein